MISKQLIRGGVADCIRASYFKSNYTNLLNRNDGRREDGVIITYE